MARKMTPEALEFMRLNCGSTNLRHAERIVTRYYDRALKPAGTTAKQLPLLAAIGYGSVRSISALAEILNLDRTTVSRELALLKRRKLVAITAGDDRRATNVVLTPAGRSTLDAAYRAWQRAHADLVATYGDDAYESLLANIRLLGHAVKSIAARKRS